jgi:hypothetical protein
MDADQTHVAIIAIVERAFRQPAVETTTHLDVHAVNCWKIAEDWCLRTEMR